MMISYRNYRQHNRHSAYICSHFYAFCTLRTELILKISCQKILSGLQPFLIDGQKAFIVHPLNLKTLSYIQIFSNSLIFLLNFFSLFLVPSNNPLHSPQTAPLSTHQPPLVPTQPYQNKLSHGIQAACTW